MAPWELYHIKGPSRLSFEATNPEVETLIPQNPTAAPPSCNPPNGELDGQMAKDQTL